MAKGPVKGKPSQSQQKVQAAQQRLKVRFKANAQPVSKTQSEFRRESFNSLPSVRLGLTIRQMMKETSARTIQLMNLGDVTPVKMRKTQSGYSLLCETVTHHDNKMPTKYKQVFENLDERTDNFGASKWIKVSCTCPNFKFERDYSLWEKGSSDLKQAIPEPPNVTNPIIGGKRRLGVCKHIFKCMEVIVQTGR